MKLILEIEQMFIWHFENNRGQSMRSIFYLQRWEHGKHLEQA